MILKNEQRAAENIGVSLTVEFLFNYKIDFLQSLFFFLKKNTTNFLKCHFSPDVNQRLSTGELKH